MGLARFYFGGWVCVCKGGGVGGVQGARGQEGAVGGGEGLAEGNDWE